MRISAAERFARKVDKNGPIHPTLGTPCWLWTGCKSSEGYGHFGVYVGFRIPMRVDKAHRVAWEMANGPIPEGMKACHHCDNPPCVNDAHLFLGTDLDNVRDATAKGRRRAGEHNAAKTHCTRGHPYSPENTYIVPGSNGRNRQCRRCTYERNKSYCKAS